MYIGLDIGTTTLSAVILDTESGQLLAHQATPNRAGIAPGPGRAELNMSRLAELTVECLTRIVTDSAIDPPSVRGIGVTGQQHGVAFFNGAGLDGAGLDGVDTPARTAITWQDLRAQEMMPGSNQSYLHQLIQRAGGVEAFRRMGCVPAAGFLGTTLFWLRENEELPSPPVTACFIPDAIVTFLTGARPASDPTLAASSGLFDIIA
ncbi:MAG: FGGY family carbohydrate kinase, partial [Caldilineaceae bacterium]